MNQKQKIYTIAEIQKVISKVKMQKKTVALCHGVFDQLHIGHVHHLAQAKKMADYLIVTITADKYVKKGPGKPYFNELNRLKMLASLEHVNFVSINYQSDAIQLIKLLKPNFYFKGPDYKNKNEDITGKIKAEIKAAKSVKCKVLTTNEDVIYSSSSILNKKKNIFDTSQKKLIDKIRKNFTFNEISI